MIASTRMYNVAPGATAAWRRLLERVARDSGIAMEIVDHPHPATLESLWQRPDLVCAFMCGWPLAKERGRRPVIAAPVPLGASAARYHSVFVVRDDAPAQTVQDTFGGVFGFNAKGSHSGWNMPQAHLAGLRAHYLGEVGPYGPHQRTAEAVVAGEADVAALDSLVWALLQRHAPDLAGRLRAVGRTTDQPAPPLVGADALPPEQEAALRTALLGLHADAAGRALLGDVGLARFAAARLADYDETLTVTPAPGPPSPGAPA